jgi:hypothetical protein
MSLFLFLGFGAVLMCWSMPTFRRNILSPFSTAEAHQHGAKTQKLKKKHYNNRSQNLKSHVSMYL